VRGATLRGFFAKIGRALCHIDDLKFIIPAILLGALLVVGPVLASVYFLRSHHYLAAVVSGSLWILTVVACIRDFRRPQFSVVSQALGVVWLPTTLVIL